MDMLRHFLIMPVVFCLDIESLNENGGKSEILKQYYNYEVIVHFDNITVWEIDDFYNINGGNCPVMLLFNYDSINFELTRPHGYRYLNLVYLTNPFDFEQFSTLNIRYVDVVLFIINDLDINPNVQTNYQLKTLWTQNGLNNSGSVILYDVGKDDFYHVRFYFGKTSGLLNKITVTGNDSEDATLPDLPSYINEFVDFNGHIFYVAYYPYAPFIWCESKIVDGPGCNVKGIEGNILLLLSKYLNFTFVMKHAQSQTSDSIWRDMIEDVHYGQRDWAVGGMSTSSERMQLVDFTTMLHMESYTTFYVSPEIQTATWDGAFRPFKFNTWIQLFIDIICIGITIKIIAIFYKLTQYLHFADSLSVPFYVILEQSVLPNLRTRVFNLKLILSIWFLMSIIITTAYRSKLASTMIKPVQKEPSSILDLYNEEYTFQVNTEDWSVLQENLQESTDQRYVNIIDRCNNELTFCEALAATLPGEVAIIDEDTPMQYIILESCHNYTRYQMSRFRLATDYLFPSVHAWPVRYGAPFKQRFSFTLQRLVDSGIIEYWYKSLISKPISKSNSYQGGSTSHYDVLKLSNIYGPLLMLVGGELLAMIVFTGEILYFKYFKSVTPIL